MLPYASDFRPTRRPVITAALLFILTLLTILVVAGPRFAPTWAGPQLLERWGIVPAHFNPLTLVTYLFFHESFGHLLVNLVYLWVFGAGVEAALGRGRFLLFFVAGGVLGGGCQWLLINNMLPPEQGMIPIVGASAGCACIIGLFAQHYYRTRMDFVGLSYRPHVVQVVGVFLLYEIGSGLWNLVTGAMGAGVAHWAHIGGFVFGLVCANLLHLGAVGSSAYLRQDAQTSMDKNVPGNAIKKWQILLAREPDNATAESELARAWLLLGDTEQATAHFQKAIQLLLSQNKRAEGALRYAEMRDSIHKQGLDTRDGELSTEQLFVLGSALEELEQYSLAADTLRAVTIRQADGPESEVALLKVITLYVHRLNRREEANVLLRLFQEKYPHSAWRNLTEELRRAANTN